MSAPSPGTSTRFRLARITGLVLGSLVFLHACERSKSALPSDVRVEVAVAAALAAAALAAAWFEIKLRALEQDARPSWDDPDEHETPSSGNFRGRAGHSADPAYGTGRRAARSGVGARPAPAPDPEDDDQPEPGRGDLVAGIARTLRITRSDISDDRQPLLPLGAMTKWLRRIDPDDEGDPGELDDHDETEQVTRTETGELVIESSRRTVRVRISRSGDLVVHGRGHSSAPPRSEWKWTFQPDTFPAIRAALGDGHGDLLDLLEETVPWLDAGARHDPGAWLRAHDIPATYREKGVSATQETRELPVLQPGRPPGRSPRKPPRDTSGASRTPNRAVDARSRREESAARSPEPPPTRAERRSTQRSSDDSQSSSRRHDADRVRGDAPRSPGRHPSADYASPPRRYREDPEPARQGRRSPRSGGADPLARPTPGRPDLPRRRHQAPADDPRPAGAQPEEYDDADVRRPRTGRQAGRRDNPQTPADLEARTRRRERPEPPYRDGPPDPGPERTYDQPPPGRRRRGDQRSRQETSHESSRRGW
ncbi:hypothetical protein IU427_03825 [Nocardia beijingensis]|uniref:hypothetical protein n=1 Tax=Nocardia beijingensis TaxID=95162 RepID=UPI001892E991|nr:hypothetical protein [Nocardia beijingensis]MBF6464310.1 hypothetical protein [Nocardia beijingensis]